MKITTVRIDPDACPDVVKCPSVDLLDIHPDRVYFIGNEETDQAIVDAFASRIGPGEALYWQPAAMHPDITR